jgi:hypothetical protein
VLPCGPVGIRWPGLKGTCRTEVMSLGPAGQGMFMVRYGTGFLSDAHDGPFHEAELNALGPLISAPHKG